MRKKSRKKFPDALNNKVSSLLVPLGEKIRWRPMLCCSLPVFTIPKKLFKTSNSTTFDKTFPWRCAAHTAMPSFLECNAALKIKIENDFKNTFEFSSIFDTIELRMSSVGNYSELRSATISPKSAKKSATNFFYEKRHNFGLKRHNLGVFLLFDFCLLAG